MALSLRKSSDRGVRRPRHRRPLPRRRAVDSGRLGAAARASSCPPGLVRDGEVTRPPTARPRRSRAFVGHGLPKRVRLGVSNQQIVVRQIELPCASRTTSSATPPSASRRPRRSRCRSTRRCSTTRWPATPTAPDGTARMQVVLVAARRSMVEALLEAAKEAGLKPEGIDLDAFALVRTLAAASAGDSEEVARVFCHLGGVTNLAIAVGTPASSRGRSPRSGTQDDVGSRLADEIRLSIDYYMAQPGAARWARWCSPARARATRHLVDSAGRAPRPAPLGGGAARRSRPVVRSAGERSAPLHRGRRPRAGGGGMKPVNLLPERAAPAPRPSGHGSGSAYVVVGLLGVLLVMAVAYVLTANKVNRTRTTSRRGAAGGRRAEAEVAALGAFGDFAPVRRAALASVDELARRRASTGSASCASSRTMLPAAPGCDHRGLRHGRSRRRGRRGRGRGHRRGRRPAGPAATLAGCTRSQSEVAKLMVRLRQMHRVTDVELNESDPRGRAERRPTPRHRELRLSLRVRRDGLLRARGAGHEAPRGSQRVPASLGGGS